MVHLRLIVPTQLAPAVLAHLRSAVGVAHVVHVRPDSADPPGEVVLCDVVREAANEIVEWLQDQAVHRAGAITIEALEAVVSDAAEAAEAAAPGQGADALIWEELEARARAETPLTASFLVFMCIASTIAGVGILLDSPILIVGAMVVGPEYGALASICVAMVRGRLQAAARAGLTLGTGLAAAALASLVATLAFRLTGLAPDHYDLGDRQLTAFISDPDGMTAVVAVLAGVVGMLSLTEGRSGALVGVLVSVTTIPAVANLGVATAYAEWAEVGGAALQLAINLTGLILAGAVTLAVQSRATARTALFVGRSPR
jgi:uncharacterized hydrophobic protein (TIGR00271 family)